MRSSRGRNDRDDYADAGKAMRWAMSRFDATRSEAKWSAADTDVFHTLLRHIGTYSRMWDAMSVAELSRLSGRHERTCARSMKKLDVYDVIGWVRGDGRDWSEVYLPTSEGRPHVAAPPSSEGRPNPLAAGDGSSEPAAPGTATYDLPRGGHMSPPEPRRHFSREDTSPEKQVASQPTYVPAVEGEEGAEQSSTRRGTIYIDPYTGEEIESRSNAKWPRERG